MPLDSFFDENLLPAGLSGGESGDELTVMTSALAQQEANADFKTEQQAIKAGMYDHISNY
ncbi:TPA: hypothetical protein QCI16_002079 [Enterobacter ludwigii]|nr:hypothetical protein [Enterobacter ludwigii]HDR2597922.1 hypothetical protein [Enterobacter ludwigii]